MLKAMNREFIALLAAATLVAASASWISCGSDDSDSPAGGNPPPPLPTSSEGWTVLTPSSDTRMVYVSSSTGNDSNDGLSEVTPKATLAAGIALLRDDMPDWLLLKAGDTWTNQDFGMWTKSGRSTSERMVVTSYGTGARPLIQTGANTGLFLGGGNPVNYLAFVGFHLNPHTRTAAEAPTGIMVLSISDSLLFEDLFVERYKDNFTIQSFDGPIGSISNISLRRCVVVDSFVDTSVGHSQGIFAAGINGLLIEECVFDRNGSPETIFRHNMYLQLDCDNVTVRGNIIARASSHGLQLRPGGVAENNLFLRNSLAMFCAGQGSGPQSIVRDNVILDGKNIDGQDRGQGIQVFDSQNVLVENNIVAHKPPGVGTMGAYSLKGYQDDDPTANYAITFEDNIAYEWNGPGLEAEATYTALTVRNNIIQDLTNANAVIVCSDFLGFEVFENNQYWTNASANSWFWVAGSPLNLSGWVSASNETGAQAIQVSFPDPDRTIASYQTSLGRTPTLEAFLAEARQQSKALWRPAYMADAVNDYIRAGFGR